MRRNGAIAGARQGNETLPQAFRICAYPAAQEATISRNVSKCTRRGMTDEINEERSRLEAARRASAKVRRYVVANELSCFATLTFSGLAPTGDTVNVAMKELVAPVGTRCGRIAWLWVPHAGQRRGRLHVHAFFGKKADVRGAWRYGLAELEYLDSPQQMRERVGYVAKQFVDPVMSFKQRYRCAQGFQPEVHHYEADSVTDGLAHLTGTYGVPSHIDDSKSGALIQWN